MSQATKKPPAVAMLELQRICTDGDTQPRVSIDLRTVEDYAEDLQRGCEFPPVTVFYDGKRYWLASGFHRFHAHKRAGRSHLACVVEQGGQREARLHAAGTNAEHGLRRSNADKRRAVWMVLNDEEGKSWSPNRVAAWCHVSPSLVKSLLVSVAAPAKPQGEAPRPAGAPELRELIRPAAGGAGPDEEDVTAVRLKVTRLLRKLDRAAAFLGVTSEQLLAEHRARQAEKAKGQPAKDEEPGPARPRLALSLDGACDTKPYAQNY